MKLRNKKTGEIGEIVAYDANKGIFAVRGKGKTKYYYSITELNEEWEDYIPKEPRIDNEEIREIIRAWAKVNDAMALKYNYDENSLDDIYRNTISFNYGLGLRDGHTYTIPELCGEEEAPEPIEPTFIDLDERVKEKGEE